MKRIALAFLFPALFAGILRADEQPRGHRPLRPVHTYSIVARDPITGELGVAVQSHWFSVGTAVPWAEAGVGAVATQSFVETSYGPLGLELMRAPAARRPTRSAGCSPPTTGATSVRWP